jgi:UDP-glucuronate 4-epimerase
MIRSSDDARFLVTGALGCIGAWTVRELVRDGYDVVALDLSDDVRRMRLVMDDDELAAVTLASGDIGTGEGLDEALDAHGITHVIHLAALQLPFCKADPVRGAVVNVGGTARVFEAVKEREDRIEGVAYASSIAVYGRADEYPSPKAAEDAPQLPHSLYGVYKAANERAAAVAWEDDGIASIGLRPYTVYGLGRDQGLTSTPTQAMLAAAEGRAFHISFGGRCIFSHARDVARAFILAAQACDSGAMVCNVPGPVASMTEVVDAIEEAAPEVAGRITFEDIPLPFPEDMESSFEDRVAPLPQTALVDGVRETIDGFRGKVEVS